MKRALKHDLFHWKRQSFRVSKSGPMKRALKHNADGKIVEYTPGSQSPAQ